jgi:hypothetical protein
MRWPGKGPNILQRLVSLWKPSPEIQVPGTITQAVIRADISIPAIQVSAYFTGPRRTDIALNLPAIQVSGHIISGAVIHGALKLPAIKVAGNIYSFASRFDLKLPALQLSMSAKSGSAIKADISLPAIQTAITFGAVVPVNNVLTGALSLPALKASISMVSGSAISATLNLPVIGLSATFSQFSRLIFALGIPAIVPHIEIVSFQIATASGAPVRKAFVMNLSHFGITEYNNYLFNSLCDYHQSGIYIGASEEGIFVLDGEDDNGVKIDSVIQSGSEDLWADVIKRLREGFVTMRGGPLRFKIIRDEGRLDPVILDLLSVQNVIHEERVKFPRGLKNRFDSFALENIDGSDFSLESFRIFCDQIAHRKR